ncbi:Serine/threonine-protein kinase 24 [Perkinsus olseni]|uniref:non-specific serine/threonine protein kinase n=1 Tax=Perkinsus olseni TaxID=32597 RepID=A0A7J6NVN3_PEROL|nr:Serine/threonine-protein kinase 24 [Perkinsus olseni]
MPGQYSQFVPGFELRSANDNNKIYLFHHLLGEGAFGQVWRCTDLSSETEVALKVVDCNAVGNESLKGIEKEIELTAKARSAMGKLCPKFYEAFRVDLPDPLVPSGRSFVKYLIMSMEFIDGVPLDKLIEFSLLNETVCAYVVYNILLALKDLHEKHIIHRDIKAANIMIGKSGRVVLCDFGVSRLLEKEAQALTFTGTPFWMAPEVIISYSLSQKSGGSGQVPGGLRAGYDCRADIWSLGVTAVEACLGHPPHADKFARMPHMVYLTIVKDPPPTMDMAKYTGTVLRGRSAGCVRFSDTYRDFLGHCFQKCPDDRMTASQLLKCRTAVFLTPLAVFSTPPQTRVDNRDEGVREGRRQGPANLQC